MKHLRKLSARPHVVIDNEAARLTDGVAIGDRIGRAGPLGRMRVVSALPTNKAGGPRLLEPGRVLHDSDLCYLADPDGNLLGVPPLWVHRLLSARWTQDTRRLAV